MWCNRKALKNSSKLKFHARRKRSNSFCAASSVAKLPCRTSLKRAALTRTAREPLRLAVPGVESKFGVSSVVADGLFGLRFADGTAAYFLLEVDRGSMPVHRQYEMSR